MLRLVKDSDNKDFIDEQKLKEIASNMTLEVVRATIVMEDHITKAPHLFAEHRAEFLEIASRFISMHNKLK